MDENTTPAVIIAMAAQLDETKALLQATREAFGEYIYGRKAIEINADALDWEKIPTQVECLASVDRMAARRLLAEGFSPERYEELARSVDVELAPRDTEVQAARIVDALLGMLAGTMSRAYFGLYQDEQRELRVAWMDRAKGILDE